MESCKITDGSLSNTNACICGTETCTPATGLLCYATTGGGSCRVSNHGPFGFPRSSFGFCNDTSIPGRLLIQDQSSCETAAISLGVGLEYTLEIVKHHRGVAYMLGKLAAQAKNISLPDELNPKTAFPPGCSIHQDFDKKTNVTMEKIYFNSELKSKTSCSDASVCICTTLPPVKKWSGHPTSSFVLCFFLSLLGSLAIVKVTKWFWSSNHNRRKECKPNKSIVLGLNPHPPLEEPEKMFRITWGFIILIFISAPLIAMWLALVISYCFNFDQVLNPRKICSGLQATKNFVPSISACIAENMNLVASVWRFNVMFYVWQRFFSAIVSYYHYKDATKNTMVGWNTLRLVASCFENLGLMMLSAVSSRDRVLIHEISFVFFAVGQTVVMVSTICLIQQWIAIESRANQNNKFNPRCSVETARRALRWRFSVTVFNVSCLVIAICIFVYHEREDVCPLYPLYSYFAIFEWLYVVSGIFFIVSGEQIELWYVDLSFIHANKINYKNHFP